MKVKQLLTSRKKWTRGAFATDEFGNPIAVDHEFATCWCLAGAIAKCYGHDPDKQEKVFDMVTKVIKGSSRGRYKTIVDWNDSNRRTFEQVKALVKELNI